MSFRLFIYYSAVCGAWAAFVGWFLGRLPSLSSVLLTAGLKGLCLGAVVALVLSFLDALWTSRQVLQIVPRILISGIIGSAGGLFSGLLGQALYGVFSTSDASTALQIIGSVVQVLGWTFVGLLIGSSIGVYEWLIRLAKGEDAGGTLRKMRHSLVGGTIGGILGGLSLVLLASSLFPNKADPWTPGALGFVILGACIGLLIGLSQVIFMEAWVKVESGFRAGRELIISKPVLVIGRAEGCDIGLFGDNTIEKTHAKIYRDGHRYMLIDAGTQAGTYLNDHPVNAPTPLHSGDRIRVGRCVLLFGERQKKSA